MTYYDDYTLLPSGYGLSDYTVPDTTDFSNILASQFESSPRSVVTGSKTGTKVLNLNTSSWYTTAVYYDDRGRVIQSKTSNHLSGYDRISTAYNFAGEIMARVNDHLSSYDTISIAERFVYDHKGRLMENYHQIGGEDEIMLASYEYNTLGELAKKYLYSDDTGSGEKTVLQKVDYMYNIRGWLEEINDVDDMAEDKFAMKFAYGVTDATLSSMNPTAQYNGNISSVRWNSKDNSSALGEKAYVYDYDQMNRLVSADYGTETNWSTDAFDMSVGGYDENGNIESLSRYGSAGTLIDNLSYDYISGTNKLEDVADASGIAAGFLDGVTQSTEYDYDENGNMEHDYNKGMDISYNILNLPDSISKSDDYITNIYDAAGVKLQRNVHVLDTTVKTDYVGAFVYIGGELSYILTSEGKINVSSGGGAPITPTSTM